MMAVLIPLAIIVAFVALFVSTARLRRRLGQAEARLDALAAALARAPGAEMPAPEATPSAPLPAPALPEPVAAPAEAPRPAWGPAHPAPPPLPKAPADIPPARTAPSFAETVLGWLQENWFYAISALSLALAGLFAAQYAAERGMLSPQMRLMLAAALGAAMIGAGEVIRRRWGDGVESATAYLPSVFSGAGLVTLYGTVLTAQMLYGLIAPGPTLALLVLIAAGALATGWFHGPLLAAVGLIGATAAPFLAGGEPGAAWMILSYFLVVMLSGLSINALRKWRFMTELALALPFGAASLVQMGLSGGMLAYIGFAVAFIVLGSIFLGGALRPRFEASGPLVSLAQGKRREVTWTRVLPLLVWGAGIVGIVLAAGDGWSLEQPAAIVAPTGLFVLGALWSRSAPGADDFVLLSGAALIWLSLGVRPQYLPVEPLPDGTAPYDASAFYLLLAAALIASLTAAWRSAGTRGAASLWWAQGAALIGPGILALQELLHTPGAIIGAPLWASIAMGFAAVATALGERARRVDGADHSRVSLAALAAMALIALALFIVLSEVALAVLVLGAVAMDTRWQLKHLSWFAQAGVAVLVYRAVADPGLFWALDRASYFDLFLGYALPAVALAAAWLLLRGSARVVSRAVLEGGFATVLGTGVSAVIERLLSDGAEAGAHQHLTYGLVSAVWLLSGGAALRNAFVAGPPGRLAQLAKAVRIASASVSFAVAALAMGFALMLNPLGEWSERVLGPVVFSSLAPAYLLPGLILLAFALRLTRLVAPLRVALGSLGAALTALYLFETVAQAWRGNWLANAPMRDGELWSYTALLLLIGGALLLAALLRRATWLRYLADGVLGVAIAKVFLVDASGLEGLVRAGSFLILGLALAGLAWINRLAARAIDKGAPPPA